jgi:cell wall-associated NlpC family hydrolase
MADDHAAALRLLQGLVDDPALRARFRADPTAVADEAGLPRVARELADRPDAPLALEVRESRSGLAGVLMAAAVEGLAIGDLLEHTPDAQASVPASADRPSTPARPDAPDQNPASPQPLRGATPNTDAPDDYAALSDDDASAEPPDDDSTRTDVADDGPDEPETKTDGDEDEDEPDEDEPDEDEPDEDEPDEDEPDEDEDEDEDDEDEEDEEDEAPGDDAGDSEHEDEDDLPPATEDDSGESGDGESDDSDDPGESGESGDEPDLPDGPQPYPGDDAPKAQRAAWMAAAARDRGLPPELPVMASLVESGLSNLPGGDRDSVGYFQMRTSIWDQGAYAGYADKPERQLDWFLDQAEAVQKQRIARGLAVDDERQYGEWIADVERPAAQYRGRYQEQLDEAQALLRAISDSADAQHEGPQARQALALAQGQLGRPYRWGGSTPDTGFDCSGLVQWAYKKVGIELPRVTQDQVNAPGGRHIGRRDLLPGDLVFFRDKTGDVHHVGISMGGDRFVHAPHTGGVVHESSLNEPYYRDEFIGGRRFAAAVNTDRSHDVQRLPAVKREPG